MKYMGSKNRHAKDILPIILKDRQAEQWYLEPFVGGFNVIDKVYGNRIANDIHYYLIELFKAVQAGWVPPNTVLEAEYKAIRLSKSTYPPYLVGFVGFGCSYAGKWFGGYARSTNNRGEDRNHALESKKSLLKQVNGLQDCIICNYTYWDLPIPPESIVYCDPPYKGTVQYKNGFDHKLFWGWVVNLSNRGHTVFVSEYVAPDNFICVWEKQVHNTLDKNTGSKQGIERLFRLKG